MSLKQLAVPSAYTLIIFLAYSSQFLFSKLDPAPLSYREIIIFNVLVICTFITYSRTVLVDPGTIPKRKTTGEKIRGDDDSFWPDEMERAKKLGVARAKGGRTKWCRRCEAVKPPRAHHCKECKRCIPKMDHHCPWTANCVSHTTFPHFLRFLLYTTLALLHLSILLSSRLSHLWSTRHLPAYLGPSPWALAHLAITTLFTALTLFAIAILLLRNLWSLAVNTTTIEGWEIERHRTLVRRARVLGGFLEDRDGRRVRIMKQEFPYDVGIWANCKQGMGGTANFLDWFNPFARTPDVRSGLAFPTNGFEDEGVVWPPPDPDRVAFRGRRGRMEGGAEEEPFVYPESHLSPEASLVAFQLRQKADMVLRQRRFADRFEQKNDVASSEDENEVEDYDRSKASRDASPSGEEGWRNSEGERLQDFGLDEEVEFYDEEDEVPLGKLLARRKQGYQGL